MVYRGTDIVEVIAVSPMNALDETHYINIIKSANEPTFYVTCCCDEDWMYEFYLESNADYERVKWNIMNTIFDCETIDELLNTLSEIFEDGFEDIIVNNCDCDGGCDHCNCR